MKSKILGGSMEAKKENVGKLGYAKHL